MAAPSAIAMDGVIMPSTRLLYFNDMWALQSSATLISLQVLPPPPSCSSPRRVPDLKFLIV
jgi:hypothetical protein